MPRLSLTMTALLLMASLGRAEDWPGWRGPTGRGITDDLGDPSSASAAVAGGRIFIRRIFIQGGRNLYCIGKRP